MAVAEVSKKKTSVAKKPAVKKSVVAQDSAARVTYLYDLHSTPGFNKSKMRMGRGESSKSKTSERDTKGTEVRCQVPARFEGDQVSLHMCLPKLRGFKNPFHVEYQVVNLDRLGETFLKGGTLTVVDLVTKGLVRKGELVKVLGSGEAGVKFDLIVDVWLQSVKIKVKAKGGNLTIR